MKEFEKQLQTQESLLQRFDKQITSMTDLNVRQTLAFIVVGHASARSLSARCQHKLHHVATSSCWNSDLLVCRSSDACAQSGGEAACAERRNREVGQGTGQAR
eukprot:4228440-Pyramimonas_sp.AAC.1